MNRAGERLRSLVVYGSRSIAVIALAIAYAACAFLLTAIIPSRIFPEKFDLFYGDEGAVTALLFAPGLHALRTFRIDRQLGLVSIVTALTAFATPPALVSPSLETLQIFFPWPSALMLGAAWLRLSRRGMAKGR